MMKQSTGIGILIRNRRKELGMNQAELSKRSTLSQAHVSRIEAGISYPSVFTILKLAKGLQLPPEALIAAVCMPAASVWQDQLHRMENMQYGILTAMAEAFGVAHTFPAGKRRNNSMQTGVSHR